MCRPQPSQPPSRSLLPKQRRKQHFAFSTSSSGITGRPGFPPHSSNWPPRPVPSCYIRFSSVTSLGPLLPRVIAQAIRRGSSLLPNQSVCYTPWAPEDTLACLLHGLAADVEEWYRLAALNLFLRLGRTMVFSRPPTQDHDTHAREIFGCADGAQPHTYGA